MVTLNSNLSISLNPLIRSLLVLVITLPLQAALPLKVVTWNLEWFPGKRPTASASEAEAHMKATQAALQKINPDIFIGVEVRDWAVFHELVSAVPGLTTNVVSTFIDPETGEIRPQQIGIASKLTCRAADSEAWKANVPNSPRGFAFAALEQKNGSLLMVYGLHLKSNRGDPAEVALMRNDQARQIIAQRPIIEKAFSGKAFADKQIAGWIVTGDLNTNHDGQFSLCKVIEQMTAAGFRNTWADTPQKDRLTWESARESEFKPTTFDYFMTLGLGDLTATMLKSPPEISDHRAIMLMVPQD
jgi:endonuclease/exonuclease/phosphatase family metal-dependent hydrolase